MCRELVMTAVFTRMKGVRTQGTQGVEVPQAAIALLTQAEFMLLWILAM
jgi:hypothetical protein